MYFTGRGVLAARRDGETLPSVALHGHAKALQQIEGDFNVGLGNQFTHDFNRDGLPWLSLTVDADGACDQWQRQQQCGQELTGNIATHTDGDIQVQGRWLAVADLQWRVARLPAVTDRAAQLNQCFHQVANGALVHACNATEGK